MTSKIHEIAVAIRDCERVALAADRRTEELDQYRDTDRAPDGAMISTLKSHAEAVRDDAGTMRSALEEELTVHVPQTMADVLTQLLVVADYYHVHDLVPDSAAERVVRLLICRVIEGLFAIEGPECTPAAEVYPHERWLWPARVKRIEEPFDDRVVPGPTMTKPFRAA